MTITKHLDRSNYDDEVLKVISEIKMCRFSCNAENVRDQITRKYFRHSMILVTIQKKKSCFWEIFFHSFNYSALKFYSFSNIFLFLFQQSEELD